MFNNFKAFLQHPTHVLSYCCFAKPCVSFDQLPNEIILEIFKYLSILDLCRVSQVSKRFRQIGDDSHLAKKEIQHAINYFNQCIPIVISYTHQVRPELIEVIDHFFPNKLISFIVAMNDEGKVIHIGRPEKRKDLLVQSLQKDPLYFPHQQKTTSNQLFKIISFSTEWQPVHQDFDNHIYSFKHIELLSPSTSSLTPRQQLIICKVLEYLNQRHWILSSWKSKELNRFLNSYLSFNWLSFLNFRNRRNQALQDVENWF